MKLRTGIGLFRRHGSGKGENGGVFVLKDQFARLPQVVLHAEHHWRLFHQIGIKDYVPMFQFSNS